MIDPEYIPDCWKYVGTIPANMEHDELYVYEGCTNAGLVIALAAGPGGVHSGGDGTEPFTDPSFIRVDSIDCNC